MPRIAKFTPTGASASGLTTLVQERHEAFNDLKVTDAGRAVWPPRVVDHFAQTGGIAEIDASELTAEVLASGITHHGALIVREALSAAWVEQLVEDVDRAVAGHDAWRAGAPTSETAPWFVPFVPDGGSKKLAHLRQWVRNGGGCWVADSPRAFADLVAAYEEIGLRAVIEEHLGERPALSVNKATLRRVRHDLERADWHQDGAFLERGAGIRTVNAWLALSDCGVDAPGLDLFPGRLDEIVETGTEGAWFDWSVGPGTVDRLLDGRDVARPVFRAGDIVLFDEYNLHRTALDPAMTRDRYAVECWFFAPSGYPGHHVPILF
jgi:ectoine hydroxylase-related dioxygenase (phytanoyl-CoA dioxygenase family)